MLYYYNYAFYICNTGYSKIIIYSYFSGPGGILQGSVYGQTSSLDFQGIYIYYSLLFFRNTLQIFCTYLRSIVYSANNFH